MSKCDIVKRKADDYLFPCLSICQMDIILEHLVKCKECRNYYINYAKKKNYHFNLVREIFRLEMRSLNDCIYQGKRLRSMTALLTEDDQPKKSKKELMQDEEVNQKSKDNEWSEYYIRSDYSFLMNAKAVREIMLSQNEQAREIQSNDELGNNQSKFTRFLVKKVCQKIDHLEKCLAIKE